jgi:adenosylmethionine-8-amino-7-oxononanoate aminotransferase
VLVDRCLAGNEMCCYPFGMSAPAWLQQDLRLELPDAVRGEGIRLWDSEGREYIDACSGAISVISIGHGVREVAEAMATQARELAYVHSTQFRHRVGEELAATIAGHAPGSLDHVCFYSGGSEAIEAAVKLARHYHLLRGNESKHLVLTRPRSYHGATLFALGIGGVASRQAPYTPYLSMTPRHDPHSADDLERVIAELDADNVSCYIAEPIGGAAWPGFTPAPGYYERIREICDAHGILFIADEIITGWGRTGKTFGIEHWDAQPDMIVSAKGLSGGYVPLSAVIFSDEIASVFADGATPFVHNLTYEAHPVAAAAALVVIGIIERDGLVENAARQGKRLFAGLTDLVGGDVGGKGLLAAVGSSDARRLRDLARDRGLMVYPGADNDAVMVTPPLIVTDEEVDLIVERLALALRDFGRV